MHRIPRQVLFIRVIASLRSNAGSAAVQMIADVAAIIGSLDVVFGEIDR